MKKIHPLAWFLLGLAGAFTVALSAQVYNFFPPPGMSYNSSINQLTTTNPLLIAATIDNPGGALNQKFTQAFNGTVAGSIATNICATTDAGVITTTDCLQLLRGSGATFNGFAYNDSTGNNFSFTGNDLVVNEPGKNPLVLTQDSNPADFTGVGGEVDAGATQVAGGIICLGHTNTFGAEFTGGAGGAGGVCAIGNNMVILASGGATVPTSIGAGAVLFEGDGSTYTKTWVGPTPVPIETASYAAGVVNSTWGSNANASNVTNIIGGSAANTQVNGVQIANTQSGTFTITYTGMTASVTGTAVWTLSQNIATLYFPAATGTSNATSFTATGLPAAIQPTRTQRLSFPNFSCENNTTVGLATDCEIIVTAASSTVTFLDGGNAAGWTNSGTKGVANAASATYLVN